MNIENARLLVENLLERIELDSSTGKFKLGTISNKEKLALETLLAGSAHEPATEATPPVSPAPQPATTVLTAPQLQPKTPSEPVTPQVTVELNLSALDRTNAEDAHVTVCLDFGTAMSKAFAIQGDSTPVELALGKRAGASGYPVESSLFISDDGVLHFGPQAVALGTAGAALGRARFDSPKARLSMGQQVDIHRAPIGKEVNPITGTPVTEGELITCLLYTSPSPRDRTRSRMPSSA